MVFVSDDPFVRSLFPTTIVFTVAGLVLDNVVWCSLLDLYVFSYCSNRRLLLNSTGLFLHHFCCTSFLICCRSCILIDIDNIVVFNDIFTMFHVVRWIQPFLPYMIHSFLGPRKDKPQQLIEADPLITIPNAKDCRWPDGHLWCHHIETILSWNHGKTFWRIVLLQRFLIDIMIFPKTIKSTNIDLTFALQTTKDQSSTDALWSIFEILE